METLVNKIKENIELFVTNAEAQVAKGNKAAGARARKAHERSQGVPQSFSC